jgi:hypothetical protein
MSNISATLSTSLTEFFQMLEFEVGRKKFDIHSLPMRIDFDKQIDQKNNSILFVAKDYPQLYTVVSSKDETAIADQINDAVFTYFAVPRYVARRLKNQYWLANQA